MKPDICVVGASNLDLISYVPRRPERGETVHGTSFRTGFGGKGANQAVMAAKLGASVAMVAKLGDDVFGMQMRKNFIDLNIDVTHVSSTDKASSGVAPILVDEEGGNSIVVVAGANDLLTAMDIRKAAETIGSARFLICQLEIPLEASLAALGIAKKKGVFTVFNPAPAPASGSLPEEIYALTDVFCPNETETEMLTGLTIKGVEDAERAGRILLAKGPAAVILTLGEKGSLLLTSEETRFVPAEKLKAVDTTGAGDAFVGSLTFCLARGRTLPEAAAYANRIAGLSVMKRGTQTSYPDRDSLPPDLKI